MSNAAEPPQRKDQSIKSLCKIHISDIPDFDELEEWTNPDGKLCHRFHYDIKMTCDDASLDVAVIHKTRRLGSQNVTVDFHTKEPAPSQIVRTEDLPAVPSFF